MLVILSEAKDLFFAFLYTVTLLSIAVLTPACAKKQKGEPVTPKDGSFSIDVSGIKKGEVRFYRYLAGDKAVVFFVARTSSGDIKTAFDACVTCYPNKMGYRQAGSRVECIFCDTAFDIDDIDKGEGNCYPIKIEHLVEGGRVIISQAEIEKGASFF